VIFLLDLILYLVAKFFVMVFSLIPIRVGLTIGRFAGFVAYLFNRKRRVVAYTNLRAAFAGKKTPAEMKRIVKRLHINFGMTLAEVLSTPKVNDGYLAKYVDIENEGVIREQLKRGGLIFLTGHFGNWELMSIASALKGFPLLVLARRQKMGRLNDGLNSLRESKGCKVISKGMPTRELIRHLHDNGVVGILNDQDSGKRAMFVDFFGRPTSTARGPFALAARAGASIIPAFMVRKKGPYHHLYLENPISLSSGDEKEQHRVMQEFASLLEKYVEQNPEQWLWFHKRWKSTPERKVIILSDGKAGHLNQSLAVYDKILQYRRELGYSDSDTKLKVVEVDYKDGFRKRIFQGLSPFFSWGCHGSLGCARMCLSGETYKELVSSFADIIISTGAGVEGVNFLFSKENNAKSVINMKPSMLSPSAFTISIIPEHDKVSKGGHVVRTLGAPNLISPERLQRDLKGLKETVALRRDRNIGLFIGGDNKNSFLSVDFAEEVLSAVLAAAERLDAGVMVTTSRRTSKGVESLIKDRLSKNSRSELVVIANENNPEWAMGGIMSAADVLVVSGESSSMISEAATSGKRVVVFPLEQKRPGTLTKHSRFMNMMSEKGYVVISDPAQIANDIESAMDQVDPVKPLDDNEKVYKAIRRIV
jgi:KDO2-lipid IV(A) lauroyltransferase